jgi:hypothetical protein
MTDLGSTGQDKVRERLDEILQRTAHAAGLVAEQGDTAATWLALAESHGGVLPVLSALTDVADRHQLETDGDGRGSRCRDCDQEWPCGTYSDVAAGLGVTP